MARPSSCTPTMASTTWSQHPARHGYKTQQTTDRSGSLSTESTRLSYTRCRAAPLAAAVAALARALGAFGRTVAAEGILGPTTVFRGNVGAAAVATALVTAVTAVTVGAAAAEAGRSKVVVGAAPTRTRVAVPKRPAGAGVDRGTPAGSEIFDDGWVGAAVCGRAADLGESTGRTEATRIAGREPGAAGGLTSVETTSASSASSGSSGISSSSATEGTRGRDAGVDNGTDTEADGADGAEREIPVAGV